MDNKGKGTVPIIEKNSNFVWLTKARIPVVFITLALSLCISTVLMIIGYSMIGTLISALVVALLLIGRFALNIINKRDRGKILFDKRDRVRVYRIDNAYMNEERGDFDAKEIKTVEWESEGGNNFIINEEVIRREKEKAFNTVNDKVQNNGTKRSMLSKLKRV